MLSHFTLTRFVLFPCWLWTMRHWELFVCLLFWTESSRLNKRSDLCITVALPSTLEGLKTWLWELSFISLAFISLFFFFLICTVRSKCDSHCFGKAVWLPHCSFLFLSKSAVRTWFLLNLRICWRNRFKWMKWDWRTFVVFCAKYLNYWKYDH